MQQFWLVVGSQKNWEISFENKNIWGLKDFRELRSLWNMLREGDGLLFYVSKPVHGIIGCGHVVSKFKQTNPLWPEEIKKNTVIWPLRFEFDVEYCFPVSLWKQERYSTQDLQLVTRMVFQCYPVEEVNNARIALGLSAIKEADVSAYGLSQPFRDAPIKVSHDELKKYLLQIGQIQGYVADEEYRLESTYLDVVWRRVERSVPTFAFEVQIGGDIYHALSKLKHAFDIWNSHIFLVATLKDRAKYEELISGTFHEIKEKVKFIEAGAVKKLLEKKISYKEMERSLGMFPR